MWVLEEAWNYTGSKQQEMQGKAAWVLHHCICATARCAAVDLSKQQTVVFQPALVADG
jgi:hypothetical protein